VPPDGLHRPSAFAGDQHRSVSRLTAAGERLRAKTLDSKSPRRALGSPLSASSQAIWILAASFRCALRSRFLLPVNLHVPAGCRQYMAWNCPAVPNSKVLSTFRATRSIRSVFQVPIISWELR
jgi:hypothetical protein